MEMGWRWDEMGCEMGEMVRWVRWRCEMVRWDVRWDGEVG